MQAPIPSAGEQLVESTPGEPSIWGGVGGAGPRKTKGRNRKGSHDNEWVILVTAHPAVDGHTGCQGVRSPFILGRGNPDPRQQQACVTLLLCALHMLRDS